MRCLPIRFFEIPRFVNRHPCLQLKEIISAGGTGAKPVTIPTFKITTTPPPTTAPNTTAANATVVNATAITSNVTDVPTLAGNTTVVQTMNVPVTQNTTFPSIIVPAITLMLSTPASCLAIQE